MKTVQRFVFLTAIAVTTTGISLLNTSSAQADTVTGNISGTWDYASGLFSSGDVFTADYSYDDAAIVPYDLSDLEVRNVGFNVPLSSLKVTVGSSYSHIFDFSDPASSFGEFIFQDFALLPPLPPYSSKIAGIEAHDGFDKADSNYFSAYRAREQFGGIPYSFSNSVEANYGSVDPNTGVFTSQGFGSTRSDSDNVTFSPDLTATAVPEPSSLLGLMGLGVVGVLLKLRVASKNARLA